MSHRQRLRQPLGKAGSIDRLEERALTLPDVADPSPASGFRSVSVLINAASGTNRRCWKFIMPSSTNAIS